jgi:transglutaminase-like putative cysteine protease
MKPVTSRPTASRPTASRQTASIPRVSLAWLLAAQTLALLPFWGYVPPWLLPLWLACSGWRVQMLRMRAPVPGRVLKLLLVALVGLGVYASRGSLIGLDAAAALLVAAFLLKLLELHSPRDARVLILLGFFCVVVAYLFDASLPWALYSLLPITALLAALIGLQQARLVGRPWATYRLALLLVGQALPLMLLLFLCFPRLEPLWSLPMPSNKGITGLADSMTPGDMAELGRSAQVAFRADFDGPLPPNRELYWRALTLERFDGQRWSQSNAQLARPAPNWQPTGPSLGYRIIQQPSGTPWLFALDVARMSLPQTRQLGDFRWQRQRPVDQTLLYSVQSWPQALREAQSSEAALRVDLALPEGGNPRARQWAAQLAAEHATPDARVQAILRQFREEDFHYTLKPPTVAGDSIDAFLFDTRRGFCAHYAGAMTFVLRAAGVPARVVAGYQGGEVNPAGNYLTVRQYQAHAWVEYWQAGSGWRSADPTAAVAPQRIEQGLEQALEGDVESLADTPFAGRQYRDWPWVNTLRLGWDNLNYSWQRWVLGYQGEQQFQLFSRWPGGLQAWLLGGGMILLLLGLSLWVLKPWRRRTDPQLREFHQFERALGRYGLRREPAEGATDFAARAARQMPAHAAAIQAFTAVFSAQRYAGHHSPGALNKALKDLRRALRSQRL